MATVKKNQSVSGREFEELDDLTFIFTFPFAK